MSESGLNRNFSPSHKWILIAVILASGMAFLDGTVVNLAIPAIQTQFAASISQIQWFINSFTLALAALLLLAGSLGDKYGRKKVFLIGMAIFIIASLASALAPTLNFLIFARAIQGLGAAVMIPCSLAIINVTFPSNSRGKAIGIWSGFSGGVAALGPFLGGWLVQTFGWPWIFYINLPIGLLAFYIAYRNVTETKSQVSGKLDILGTVWITFGLGLVAYGLIQAPQAGWSDPVIIASLISGIVSLLLFIRQETKTEHPLVPLHIFKNKLVAGANLVTLFLYFALNGLIFFLVLNFLQVQDLSPIYAGLGLIPSILIITFLSGYAGQVSDRIGPRKQMIYGPLVVAISLASFMLADTQSSYFVYFLPGLILFGLGMAFVIAPLTKSALSVSEDYSGAASGVNNAVSRIAALLAIAVLGSVAFSIFSLDLDTKLKASTLTSEQKTQIISQADKLAGIEIPDTFSQNDLRQAELAVESSFVTSFRWVMGISALLALLSSILSGIYIKQSE